VSRSLPVPSCVDPGLDNLAPQHSSGETADEQLRGGQSYSGIAARDHAGFTSKLHLDPFAFSFVYQFGVSAKSSQITREGSGRHPWEAPGASPPNFLSQIAAIDFPKYRQRKPGSRSFSSRQAACKNDWL
jgi:hypothetical protein